MRTKSTTFFLLMCFFLIPMLSNSCQAIEEKEYPLQIEITISCPLPFQSVSPIDVNVKLTNIGNETFNGNITIEGKTKDSYYASREYPVLNFTKNETRTYTYSVRTDYEGTYWFTFEIEEEENRWVVKLYEDSKLVDGGVRVKKTSSFFIHSFAGFIAILGIIVGAIVSIVIAIYMKKR